MAAEMNRFGLRRDIPSLTRRAIRRECGYGCVVCGCAIYQYEHIDPEFHEARDHLISKIALLCGACHDHVTRRLWSKDKVKRARQNPFCLRRGFAHTHVDGPDAGQRFTISFGRCDFVRPRCVLRVFQRDLLAIREPEQEGGPVRVTGTFFDSAGRMMLDVVDNEYRYMSANWDVETRGARFTIRNKPREIELDLDFVGPNHIALRRLNMFYDGIRIGANRRGIWIGEDRQPGVAFDGEIVEPECAIEVARDAEGTP